MQKIPRTPYPCCLGALALALIVSLVGCSTGLHLPAFGKLKTGEEEKKTVAAEAPPTPGRSAVDLNFLLSMDYEEAKSISAQNIETASGARLAAESIEVLKKDNQDRPIRLRAKGKVYFETGTASEAKILCQEVYLNGTEAVLRGKPILQRGGSIVEGLQDHTVFYMLGDHLRVLGLHRLTNQNAMVAAMPDLGPWKQGPNPLLPALNESVVPANIRSEMQKAAEAEAILQQNRIEANREAGAGPAKKAADEKRSKPKKPSAMDLKS